MPTRRAAVAGLTVTGFLTALGIPSSSARAQSAAPPKEVGFLNFNYGTTKQQGGYEVTFEDTRGGKHKALVNCLTGPEVPVVSVHIKITGGAHAGGGGTFMNREGTPFYRTPPEDEAKASTEVIAAITIAMFADRDRSFAIFNGSSRNPPETVKGSMALFAERLAEKYGFIVPPKRASNDKIPDDKLVPV